MVCAYQIELARNASLFSLVHKRLCVLVVHYDPAVAHKSRTHSRVVELASDLQFLFHVAHLEYQRVADLEAALLFKFVCNDYLAFFDLGYLVLVLVKIVELCSAHRHKVYRCFEICSLAVRKGYVLRIHVPHRLVFYLGYLVHILFEHLLNSLRLSPVVCRAHYLWNARLFKVVVQR